LKKDIDRQKELTDIEDVTACFHTSTSVGNISEGWRKLQDLVELCDDGWLIELYGLEIKPHYHVVIESKSDISELNLALDRMVFFDGYHKDDKIIFAYNQCPDEFNRLVPQHHMKHT
jgi:hypothetical protein